jgi:UDP-N-acetylmuramyl pentapeptide phosphotransferase/UDP-N-acetylglucosamine-1-phosphate transferase
LTSIYLFFSTLFFILFLNYFFLKNNFLLDDIKFSKHKSLAKNKKTPISLGFIFVIFCLIFLENSFFQLKLFLFLFFIIGFLSDLNIVTSARFRLLSHIILVLCFVIINNFFITKIYLTTFDYLLANKFFNIFFVTICICVLINGKNFIDGLNTLLIGYVILLLTCIYFVSINYSLNLDFNLYKITLIFFLALYSVNFFGKSILGDGGSLSIGLFISYVILNFYLINDSISPYFIALLLWYPSFEILFSIIRKTSIGIQPFAPDSLHLHQLLYKRVNYFKSTELNNTVASSFINLFNLFVFYLGSLKIYSNSYNIYLILFSIFIYIVSYIILIKKSYNPTF